MTTIAAAPTAPTVPSARPARPTSAVLAGAAAMAMVGASAAASAELAHAPALTAQALRYAVACALLVVFARATGVAIPRPRGAEWWWLLGTAATGLVLFNIALVRGGEHAEPAVFAVAIACVPIVLALGESLQRHRAPSGSVLLAAVVVSAGAVLVAGYGRTDALGVALAAGVLACEAGFTLLAVPVLGRLGAWGVSVHATWLAAVVFAVGGLAVEGPTAVVRLDARDLLVTAYLAIGVTAVAFVLWYSCVGRLGAGRAGLLTAVAPAAAVLGGIALGGPVPGPAVWLGIAVIGLGLLLGLRRNDPTNPS